MDRPAATDQADALTSRRSRVARAFHEAGAGLVLVPSGAPLSIEGTDGFYRYRAHDAFRHLTGAAEPACVLLCVPGDDAWTLFVPPPDADDAVWHGPQRSFETWSHATGIADVRARADLDTLLSDQDGVALVGSRDLIERPGSYDVHPDRLERVGWDADASRACVARYAAVRRVKDPVELRWMRAAADAAVAGHEVGMCGVRPGRTERDLALEIDFAMLRAGADGIAYDSIVLGGTRASILHGAPSSHVFTSDEVVLVDAGAEVSGYDSDITRTYPAGRRFPEAARAIYEIVLAAQEQAIAGCRPGAEFLDLHLQAMHTIAEGLVDLGVLRGTPADLVEQDAVALFFPHGLGHLLGLATHDVGGYLPDRERVDRPGLRYLRTHLPLQAGYVVTIEPGIYFNAALLDAPDHRRRFAAQVDWARVDALRAVGGVRIEDDVHVTADGPDVLTAALPKSVAAIEALRA